MKKLFIPFCFVAMAAFSCGTKNLSVTDLPTKAQEYLSEKYPNVTVKEIEKETNGYEVTLRNHIEIFFDSEGDFLSSKLD